MRVCLFDITGQRFGLRLESVREIVPMAALARPPSMPSILEGFLNLRGTALPVLRTATLLGLPQPGLELHTPLVILGGSNVPLALLVGRVMGILTVSASDVRPIPSSNSFNGCVDGVLTSAEESVHLLSVDKLLLEKEQRIVAEFQAVETRRLSQIDQPAS